MIDLTGLFALGQGLAGQAIDTSGTHVETGTVQTVTDPDTLERAETFTPTWAANAIITTIGTGTTEPVPHLDVKLGDWRIITHPNLAPPEPGHVIKVTQSRDPNLAGKQAKITGHTITSAGAVLTIYARPT